MKINKKTIFLVILLTLTVSITSTLAFAWYCGPCGCSGDQCVWGDFSLSVSPSSGTSTKWQTINTKLTVTKLSGPASQVSLSWYVIPKYVASSISPVKGYPTFSSTLGFTPTGLAVPGIYKLIIKGTNGGITRYAT